MSRTPKTATTVTTLPTRHRGAAFASPDASWPSMPTPSLARLAPPAIALTISTPRGPAHGLWRPSSRRHAAVILLPGADNAPGGPAGLYDELAPALPRAGAVVQLTLPASDYAARRDLVLSALETLSHQGIERVALIGWGAGATLAAGVGASSPLVAGVALLAPDPAAGDGALSADIAALSPRRLLIAHGSDDGVVPQSVSLLLHTHAGDLSELALYPNETHDFTRYREAALERLASWAVATLRSPFRPFRPASARRPTSNATMKPAPASISR